MPTRLQALLEISFSLCHKICLENVEIVYERNVLVCDQFVVRNLWLTDSLIVNFVVLLEDIGAKE